MKINKKKKEMLSARREESGWSLHGDEARTFQ